MDVTRLGLGLAALGRPAYITDGRDRDLPDRGVQGMRAAAHAVLDAAYAGGIRWFDAARSYGRAEEFLADWLRTHRRDHVTISSKWGYDYVGGWRLDVDVHEVKDHSLAALERQWARTRALLRPDLYQIHSVTPESGVLEDRAVHERLATLGVEIGLSTSGPRQAEVIRRAGAVEVGGRALFTAVQATWNLLEPSAGPALAAWHADGRRVLVKEVLANGRLVPLTGAGPALAAALAQPWADVVLIGAVTPAQVRDDLGPAAPYDGPPLVEDPRRYWNARSARPWT